MAEETHELRRSGEILRSTLERVCPQITAVPDVIGMAQQLEHLVDHYRAELARLHALSSSQAAALHAQQIAILSGWPDYSFRNPAARAEPAVPRRS